MPYADPTAAREYRRQYYLANKDKIQARACVWNKENKERRKQICRKYRQKIGQEVQTAYARKWRAANPERAREILARRRARKRAAGAVAFSKEQLRQRLEVSGGRCQHCGSTTHLELDHKIPLANGGPHCLSNLQHLCRDCNRSKGARFSG